MNILVVDIGGTNVKIWTTGESDKVKFPSGKTLDPASMVKRVKKLAADWKFERVSIGYPGSVINGRPSMDPYNLAPGWIDFDYGSAFAVPVRIMNDACMQALGSYEGGRMLYVGLGTSMGTTYIIDHQIVPLALGQRSRGAFPQVIGMSNVWLLLEPSGLYRLTRNFHDWYDHYRPRPPRL